MINVFVTAGHINPIRNFLMDWSDELRVQIDLATYEGFAAGKMSTSAPVIILADIERLSQAGIRMSAGLAAEAKRQGRTVLNDPVRVLTKFALLRKMHELGINDFQVYNVAERPNRWPVFLRSQHEHGGIPELLYDQSQLEASYDKLTRDGKNLDDMMITEYIDAFVDGAHRTFSFMRIGDNYIPRHAHVGSKWVVRGSSPGLEELRDEAERVFEEQLAPEHLPQIKQIYELANIEYGRIDYTIVNGKMQVWEINTHPMLVNHKKRVAADRVERASRMAGILSNAFNALVPQDVPVQQLLQFKPSALKENVHVSQMLL